MIKRILNLPVWGLLLILAALALVVLFVFSSINPWNPLNYFSRPAPRVDTSRAAVVKEIQSLNRLETVSYSVEKVIEAGNDGNVFQNILYGDRILLIAHGRVVAGVDMSQVHNGDVRINNSTLAITLPMTQIFNATLDNSRTKVYDRRLGLLSKGDKDLETQARQAAENSIRQAACDDGILQEAARNAKDQVEKMYALAGFDGVEVAVNPGVCL